MPNSISVRIFCKRFHSPLTDFPKRDKISEYIQNVRKRTGNPLKNPLREPLAGVKRWGGRDENHLRAAGLNQTVSSAGSPRYRAESSGRFFHRQEEWYRRGIAPLSLYGGQRLFCFPKTASQPWEVIPEHLNHWRNLRHGLQQDHQSPQN